MTHQHKFDVSISKPKSKPTTVISLVWEAKLVLLARDLMIRMVLSQYDNMNTISDTKDENGVYVKKQSFEDSTNDLGKKDEL